MFTTLLTAADWAAYRSRLAADLAVDENQVEWGSGPVDYPCLVTTLFPPKPAGCRTTGYSCFVYRADVEALLGPKPAAEAKPVKPAKTKGMYEFQRWVAAQQMTVAYFLTETGICTRERYEEQLLEALETVDAYRAGGEHRRTDYRDKVSRTDADVLDSFDPQG